MPHTHLLNQEERERRNKEIALKFKKQYYPGVKKYYLYDLLAKEYNLKTETIATIVHPRQWGINGGKFKSKKQELEYFRKYHAKRRKNNIDYKHLQTKKNVQKYPSHPGEILSELYLEPFKLSIKQAALKLDISRDILSAIIKGKADISVSIAIKLSKAFKTTPQYWLNMQVNYDLSNKLDDNSFDTLK